MRMSVYRCLLVFVLGCNARAEIIHKIMEEKDSIALHCPLQSVKGKVTWSREINGSKVDILIVDGDRDIRLVHDRYKRYSSLADKSLHIFRAAVSDTAKYLCNNEPAAELTVIPSGTTRLSVAERSSVTLRCPPDVRSAVPTWSRDKGGKVNREQVSGRRRFNVSPENKTLTVRDLQPGDSGLYYCDEKPAAYLNVIEDEQSEKRHKYWEKKLGSGI